MENTNTENIETKIQRSFYQKYAICAVVVLIIVTAWVFFYFLPLRRQISQSEQGIDQWGSKIKAANLSSETIENLSKQIDLLKVSVHNIEKKIYFLEDMPIIAKHLLKHGKSYGLEITSMTPNYNVLFEVKSLHSEGKPLIKLPIILQMTGRYKSVGKFISSASNLPFAFAPDRFVLTANPTIYPKIEITVTGYLFLLNEERNKEVSANFARTEKKDNEV